MWICYRYSELIGLIKQEEKMKKLIVTLMATLFISSVCLAGSGDSVLMALELIKQERQIVKEARSDAKSLVTKIDNLLAQYEDATKETIINKGLSKFDVDKKEMTDELNKIKGLMQDVLDNTTQPKSL